MDKLRTFRLFKRELSAEPYLYLFAPRRIRSAIAKFRIGNHDLAIETGRHEKLPVEKRLCKLCLSINKTFVEDEYHVLLKCEFYDELRNAYINPMQLPVNLFTFVSILSTQDSNALVKLGSFVTNMFKLRKSLFSAL